MNFVHKHKDTDMLLGLTILGVSGLAVVYKRRAIRKWVIYHLAYAASTPTERKRLTARKESIYDALDGR